MRRAGTFVAVAVLVAVPGSYLVVASAQSLSGSDRKERVAAATEPLWGRPDVTTRNIYQVPLPDYTWGNHYFETNSWKRSALYMRFETTALGLDAFLSGLGLTRGSLTEGQIPITERQQKTFGWRLDGPWSKKQRLTGVRLPSEGKGRPEHRIVVNLVDEYYSTVYVVSTIDY